MENLTDRKKYWMAIETMAGVVEEELKRDDIVEAADLVFESVDSSEYVMYYDKNLDALQYSDNEPVEFKHLFSDGDSWREVIQAMAFQVVKYDVYQKLQERDVL